MPFPQPPTRRNVRYPLHLPVSVRAGPQRDAHRSGGISVNGILLSSAFLIPEGSNVELAVGVPAPARPGNFF